MSYALRSLRWVWGSRHDIAFRACSRCQPVVAHKSSKITPFCPLVADRYRTATCLVTACRCLIVNSLPHAHPAGRQPGGGAPLRGHSLMRQRTRFADIFCESTRVLVVLATQGYYQAKLPTKSRPSLGNGHLSSRLRAQNRASNDCFESATSKPLFCWAFFDAIASDPNVGWEFC